MLGGSNCKIGGNKTSYIKKGGDSCTSRVNGGARKRVVKKGSKKVVRKRLGGGGSPCSYASFPDTPTLLHGEDNFSEPAQDQFTGGAKKRKSKKTGKSRKAGPYAKFVKKNFASVQKKNPKFKATDCIKEIAKMWKAQKK